MEINRNFLWSWRERKRESSIVSRSLPKCRYSRLVQRCLVLFAISVHSVKRGRSIHETVLAAIFRIPGSTTPPGKFCILHFVAEQPPFRAFSSRFSIILPFRFIRNNNLFFSLLLLFKVTDQEFRSFSFLYCRNKLLLRNYFRITFILFSPSKDNSISSLI